MASSAIDVKKTRARLALLWQLLRAPQWWNYKIPLALTMAYAFAYAHQIDFKHLFLSTALIVASGLASASFASLINDFCDLEQDEIAGKETILMRFSESLQKYLLGASALCSIFVAILLTPFPISQIVFVCTNLIFVFYSVRPFRLKEHGAAGVLSISLGEHLLPALLATYLVAESTGAQVELSWLVSACAWSSTFGMRGILWHQISDLNNDTKANCSTLAVRVGPDAMLKFAHLIVFPIECLSLLYLLTRANCTLAWISLGLYIFLEVMRKKYMFANIIIVNPKPNARFALFEYYQLILPLSLLLAASVKDPLVSPLIVAFAVMFAAPAAQLAHHIIHLIRSDLYQAIRKRVVRQS